MICAECETEPLTPRHYCECCGRKLSLQERGGSEAPSQAGRCPSCGGASAANGVLCKSCQHAFAGVLGKTNVTEPPHSDSPVAAAPKPPVVVVRTTKIATPVSPSANTISSKTANTNAGANTSTTANTVAEAITTEAFKSNTAKAVADQTAKAHLAKAANPPPVTKRLNVPAPPQRRSRTPMLAAAAAAVVVAIGAAEGARRLGFQWPPQISGEQEPVSAKTVVENAAPVEPPAPPAALPAAKPAGANRPAAAAPRPAAARPKPNAAADRRAAPDTRSSDRAAVIPAAPGPETAASPGPPATAVAANARREPPAPTGRFFERNDVDQPPQVATRVAPQLPANLSGRATNDVVVVRVLVSNTGHPFRVGLLRGSRLGRPADEAVVAAVTRWTFTPARKRGEPVNCWFNIGVPLGQAD